ncbi:MAG: hypothetical protein KKI09_07515 [Spirochaetes bacterium]|nr:hypothetical protein [Spirochaetota bacterium]MBU0955260.1 hypothetical protein [Spirochaetota bacterium]
MSAKKSERLRAHNFRRSITRFLDQMGHWYVLDSAAVIMPAVSTLSETFLFRMSATLDHPVNVALMQKALDRTVERYPYFLVELRRGFFWYLMQPMYKKPRLEADSAWPCMNFNVHKHGQVMFRVRLSGARVACEFHHAMTDGTGCINFLKTLLHQYFELGGVCCADPGDIFVPGQPVSEDEFEDAYHRYYKPGIPGPAKLPRAFKIDSPVMKDMKYRITAARLPLAQVSEVAKSYGISMNDLLVAALMEAWLEEYKNSSKAARRKTGHNIGIEVPVNMRKFYPTKSLRNFSLYVMVCLDARLGNWHFDELAKYVHHVMRIENDERIIARQITRNCGSLRIPLVRTTPLFVKDFFGRIFFQKMGQSMISSFISNLGPVKLPPEIAGHVRRFDFIPAPNKDTRTNASVVVWQDSMYVNLGSRVKSRAIEQRFYSRLAALGISVHLDPVEED